MIQVLCILLFLALPGYAQEEPTISREEVIKAKHADKTGFFALPVVLYLPETKIAAGGAFIWYQKLDSTEQHIKPDELTGYGLYTQNNQIMTQATATLYLDSMKYKLIGDVKIYKFPDKFFGIGPNLKFDDYEEYTPFFVRLKASLLRRVSNNIYIGANYRYYYYEIIDKEKGRKLDTANITGSDIARLSGLGFGLHIDKRNSTFFPTDGYYFDFKYRLYNGWLGSQYNFSKLDIDYRYFYQLTGSHVLAFNSELQTANGEVPFDRLPVIGGEQIMRGYHSGRYRDKSYFAFQGEYRFPIYWRFGGAAYASLGQVAPGFDKFQFDEFHPAYGVGLRINIDREEHINLRADAAYCEDGWQFYFNIKEAF